MDFKIIQITSNTIKPREGLQTPNITDKKIQGVELHEKAKAILQSSFIGVIIGLPGSGKTTLLQHLLLHQQFYGNKYERVVFVGGPQSPKLVQDQFNKKTNIDLNWIYNHINQAKQWKCKNMLIVFDDVVGQMKPLAKSAKFIDLFYNRRHLLKGGCISLLILTQKWNLVPPFIRQSYTFLIAFAVPKIQISQIGRDVQVAHSPQAVSSFFNTLKQHQFLYINITSGKIFNSRWNQL